MTTTDLFSPAKQAAALTAVGGTTLGTTRNDLLLQCVVAAATRTGGGGGSTAWTSITGKPATIDTLAAGFGGVFAGSGLIQWTGANYQLFSGAIPAYAGGTGVANGLLSTLTLPNAATTITGGGTLGLGGFTFTVPATGTAAILGIANTFSVNNAVSTPALKMTGTVGTGGTTTTNKPLFLIEPSNATVSTGWVSGGADVGTIFGINAPDDGSFSSPSRYVDFHKGSASYFSIDSNGGVHSITALGVDSVFQVSNNGLRMASGYAIGFSNGDPAGGLADAFFTRKASATIQLGADAAGVTNQMLTAASRITSDGVGANLTIAGGNGRGGAGGTLILSTYDTAGAATIGTLRSRMTFDTAGAVAFPVVTAVTTETVVSDTTWPVTINGVAYKICLKA